MIDFVRKETYGLNDLKNIVALLRGPGGCPWDAEQTHEGIRRDLLEECYEVVEAINQKNSEHLQEELGDVLWVIVCLANQTGVDLTEAMEANFAKKTARDEKRHKNNPKIARHS